MVRDAKNSGLVALRSAGSHSPIDVIIIDPDLKLIRLIQCKPDNFSNLTKGRLIIANRFLDGEYAVRFEVK